MPSNEWIVLAYIMASNEGIVLADIIQRKEEIQLAQIKKRYINNGGANPAPGAHDRILVDQSIAWSGDRRCVS